MVALVYRIDNEIATVVGLLDVVFNVITQIFSTTLRGERETQLRSFSWRCYLHFHLQGYRGKRDNAWLTWHIRSDLHVRLSTVLILCPTKSADLMEAGTSTRLGSYLWEDGQCVGEDSVCVSRAAKRSAKATTVRNSSTRRGLGGGERAGQMNSIQLRDTLERRAVAFTMRSGASSVLRSSLDIEMLLVDHAYLVLAILAN